MKILISAGPTREPIDPVRFISNRSSGKMGYALAKIAAKKHEVTLVSGPVSIPLPEKIKCTIFVETAQEMFDQMVKMALDMDVIIMTAAVADYRPKVAPLQKMKKENTTLIIELEPTQDILKHLGTLKRPEQILVGFAAETQNMQLYAQEKLKKKNCSWIVANDVSRKDIGFDSENNAVTLFSQTGQIIVLDKGGKLEIAQAILEIVLEEKNV